MPAPPALPSIAPQPLSVVLLARNSAAHVEAVLAGWLAFLDGRGGAYELLLVDDGSTDGTAALAQALCGQHPQLRVLCHAQPQGEGAALRTGLEAAANPLVCYSLCDPVYRPEMLGAFLARTIGLEDPSTGDMQVVHEIDHVHLMTGFRAGVKMPVLLRISGWLWRLFCLVVFSYAPRTLPGWLGLRRHFGWLLARTLFGVRHHDAACPFRLLRREILTRIPLQSKGPFAHVELLAKANFLGCLMGEEVAIDVRPPAYRGDARVFIADARKVFDKPDFGPATLPTPPAPPTAPAASAS
jgi:glycosyltransferase involved in cell wall biosynthesis